MATTNQHSKSLRTDQADIVMGLQPKEQSYSSNKQLKFYKNSLVQSKCLDGEAPFVHSNNYRSFTLKNVRPNNPKNYKSSVKSQIVSHNVSKTRP